MKYCPYCGAALMRGAISFCTECGRSIEETSDGTLEPFRIPDPHEEIEERREVIWNLPETKKAPGEKAYDGYYDDIVPEDGMVHEQPKSTTPIIPDITPNDNESKADMPGDITLDVAGKNDETRSDEPYIDGDVVIIPGVKGEAE